MPKLRVAVALCTVRFSLINFSSTTIITSKIFMDKIFISTVFMYQLQHHSLSLSIFGGVYTVPADTSLHHPPIKTPRREIITFQFPIRYLLSGMYYPQIVWPQPFHRPAMPYNSRCRILGPCKVRSAERRRSRITICSKSDRHSTLSLTWNILHCCLFAPNLAQSICQPINHSYQMYGDEFHGSPECP